MSPHVDIVENDFVQRRQVRLAIALVDPRDGSTALMRKNVDSTERLMELSRMVHEDYLRYPKAKDRLASLHEHIQGTYLFVTAPHEHDDCQFLASDVLPIEGAAP